MDEQLKARLIGGAVLVALVVLLVPELLSGRKTAAPDPAAVTGRGTRTYTIDLGGRAPVDVTAKPAAVQPEPAATAQPVEKPAPAAAPSTVAKSDTPEARPVVEPVTPPAEAPVATAVPSAKGGWAVQVGAFGSAGAAGRLVRELDAAGFEAYEAPVTRAGKTLYRVRVGAEAERAGADRLAARLKARGLPATVVTND